jgi:hypothetical protein
VGSEPDQASVRFEPLRPASRGRLVAGIVLGPVLWLIALAGVAWVYDYGAATGLGLLVTMVSFVVSLVVLALLHAARRREERRYAERG